MAGRRFVGRALPAVAGGYLGAHGRALARVVSGSQHEQSAQAAASARFARESREGPGPRTHGCAAAASVRVLAASVALCGETATGVWIARRHSGDPGPHNSASARTHPEQARVGHTYYVKIISNIKIYVINYRLPQFKMRFRSNLQPRECVAR